MLHHIVILGALALAWGFCSAPGLVWAPQVEGSEIAAHSVANLPPPWGMPR